MRDKNSMPTRMSTKKPSGQKRTFRGMSIRPADSGGYIVNHEFTGDNPDVGMGSYVPDEQHLLPDAGALHAHVQSMFPSQVTPATAPQANRQEFEEQA